MRFRTALTIGFLALALGACATGVKSPKGFRLPDGDVERGRATFAALKCHACHEVQGVELPREPGNGLHGCSAVPEAMQGEGETTQNRVNLLSSTDLKFSNRKVNDWYDICKLIRIVH